MRWLCGSLCGILFVVGNGKIGMGQGKKDEKTGEINTPAAKGERKTTKLRAGDPAPDFTLADMKKKNEVTLSSFQNKKPVVLIFGSYT
jgi:hypothetical protein